MSQTPCILGVTMKRRLSILTVLCLLFTGLIIPSSPGKAQNKLVGGPCAYSDYPGTATILSVEPLPGGPGNAPNSSLQHSRVRFTFSPTQPVAHRLYAQGKVHELTLSGGALPGPSFLKKYTIAPGNKFAATLHIIDSGTCSPVVFTFEKIDLTDHSGNQE